MLRWVAKRVGYSENWMAVGRVDYLAYYLVVNLVEQLALKKVDYLVDYLVAW